MLRDSLPKEQATKRRSKAATESNESALPTKRQPSYSQDVRKACGVRLVQLIPIRTSSYVAVVLASLAIPGTLLGLHYPIFVSGTWEWYGHPLVASLDVADNSRSILSWLNSQLWMFCLGATVLTFQLRKHRLDDFDGEYRLWFWMILTCLFGSINSTTQISDLFGLALNRWSQEQLGWSGPAVVHSTIAVLVGILGLRICTELKEVPSSVVFWLIGLVTWACSAALAQDAFKIDLSIQHRVWLKAVFWSGGLTCIWLAALGYLRHVYIVAQKRFLARGRMARLAERKPLRQRINESGQRIRESIPTWRRGEDEEDSDSEQRRGWLPKFRRDENDQSEEGLSRVEARDAAREAKRKQKQELAELRELEKTEKKEAAEKRREAKRTERETQRNSGESEDGASERKSWLGFFKRSDDADGSEEEQSHANGKNRNRSDSQQQSDAEETDSNGSKFGRLTGWLRKPKDDDEPPEFRKVKRNQQAPDEAHAEEEDTKRGWFNWGRNRPAEDDESNDAEPKKKQGLLARFKLQPPEEDSDTEPLAPVDQRRPLPGTTSSAPPEDENENSPRPLSRAEKKRMRRQRKNAA